VLNEKLNLYFSIYYQQIKVIEIKLFSALIIYNFEGHGPEK